MSHSLHDLVVVCNLDHTLLTVRGEIPAVNRDMIQLFCGHGGRFTVATRRSVASVQAALAGVPLSAPVICCGGSILYDMTKQQCVRRLEMNRETAEKAIRLVMKNLPDLGVCVHTGLGEWRVIRANRYLEAQRKSERIGCSLSQLSDAPDGWVQVSFAGSGQQLDQAETLLREKAGYGVYAQRSGSGTLDLLPETASNAAGLSALSETIGVPLTQMIVIGSHASDLPAMALAGQAVAVAGAPARVRLAAHVVTSIGSGDGAVAEYLYHLLRKYEKET